MNYREPSNWNEPEECKPHYFQDSEDSMIAINCMECDQKQCEHYDRWHEQEEEAA